MLVNSLPLYPDFYDLDHIKKEVSEKHRKTYVNWYNKLSIEERRILYDQRCGTIRKYSAIKSKNFLAKYIEKLKRLEGGWI